MGYIIHNPEKGWYIALASDTSPIKTTDKLEAHVWSSEKKAKNVLRSQLKNQGTIIYTESEATEREIVSDNYSMEEILEGVQELGSAINQKKYFLKKMLSYYDRREQDLLHEVEGSKYNVCEGYKYYKRMQDLRKERRKVKNEMRKIENLSMMGINKANIDKALRNAEKVGSVVKYSPRTSEEERQKYGV